MIHIFNPLTIFGRRENREERKVREKNKRKIEIILFNTEENRMKEKGNQQKRKKRKKRKKKKLRVRSINLSNLEINIFTRIWKRQLNFCC